MHSFSRTIFLASVICCFVVFDQEKVHSQTIEKQADPLVSRKFEFRYSASITDVPSGAKIRVWMPVAESDPFQTIEMKSVTLPSEAKINRDGKYGNKILYFERTQNGTGNIAAEVTYSVIRTEAQAVGQLTDGEGQKLELFLQPNTNVPVVGKPIATFEEFKKNNDIDKIENTLVGGRHFYDFVEQHMRYDKSKPGYGKGDSVWACDSQTGNCTDFHSLFISVARANKFPAKFQIGFPLPATRGSGENRRLSLLGPVSHPKTTAGCLLTSLRQTRPRQKKTISLVDSTKIASISRTGRDIELVPKQTGTPLHYFVYPYVEVDGKPYPKEKIKLSFFYKDHE